ncbi:alpha/beta hydrolase [Jidongwangia harbinensis]|uniref:alpha/beta hydrolase n=1 Tax=Jidongwangia harbinensis TaxID=2878561 RepID=UPI001CD9B8C1|nr:alpha/beta hydrolase [Jidongwangia harbinensis]MCA2218466.1 alpha/beta hydrolase [Jidongwangia harbinensis]
MDLSRLHFQARVAMQTQHRVPLTVARLAEVRRSMVDAVPAEVGTGPQLHSVADVDADGVPARWYRTGAADAPALLYAHGGGWVLGDLDTHDGLCRHLAAASGWSVLAVDYRRAPEHPYPAPVDDVERALGWLRRAAPRVAVGGDSAGAHLAAVVARRARDAGLPVAAQVLICPALDPAMAYPDLDDYGLHTDEMRFFWDAFAPPGVDRADPDLNPLAADPAGLPPAVVVTAELDILRDEGERYAARLQAAGVPVVCARYQGVNHNFVRKLALFDAAHAAVGQIAGALRRLSV